MRDTFRNGEDNLLARPTDCNGVWKKRIIYFTTCIQCLYSTNIRKKILLLNSRVRMGQTSSSPAQSTQINEEKEADVWSTVIHISDRDVLVQNIGRNKRQKVKLNNGRKSSKMDNLHLADSKRLEGIPSFKRRNASWLPKSRYPIGVVNQGCSAVEKMGEKFSKKSKDKGDVECVGDEAEECLVEGY